MGSIDEEEFFRMGLQLSLDESGRLKKILRVACAGLAVAAGAGLAQAGLRGLMQPMQRAPSKNMQMAVLLAGMGVGAIVVGSVCTVVKLKLQNYLQAQVDTPSAIGNLTPALRRELQQEARRLLAMERRILELESGSDVSDPLMA